VATVREPLLVLDDQNDCGAPIIAVVVSSGLLHPEFLEPSTRQPPTIRTDIFLRPDAVVSAHSFDLIRLFKPCGLSAAEMQIARLALSEQMSIGGRNGGCARFDRQNELEPCSGFDVGRCRKLPLMTLDNHPAKS
jgi:hypothetical protein